MKRNQPTEWTEDQKACIEALAVFAKGLHHCHKLAEFGRGVKMTWMRGELSTYDGDDLTRLVLTGHAFGVRMSIESNGPRTLKITAFKRRHGDRSTMQFWEFHPDLAALRETLTKWIDETAIQCGQPADNDPQPQPQPPTP